MNKKPVFNLNKEEQELSDSFDRNEWKSTGNLKKEKAKAHQAAARYLHEEVRINIRISEVALEHARQKAAHERLPY